MSRLITTQAQMKLKLVMGLGFLLSTLAPPKFILLLLLLNCLMSFVCLIYAKNLFLFRNLHKTLTHFLNSIPITFFWRTVLQGSFNIEAWVIIVSHNSRAVRHLTTWTIMSTVREETKMLSTSWSRMCHWIQSEFWDTISLASSLEVMVRGGLLLEPSIWT